MTSISSGTLEILARCTQKTAPVNPPPTTPIGRDIARGFRWRCRLILRLHVVAAEQVSCRPDAGGERAVRDVRFGSRNQTARMVGRCGRLHRHRSSPAAGIRPAQAANIDADLLAADFLSPCARTERGDNASFACRRQANDKRSLSVVERAEKRPAEMHGSKRGAIENTIRKQWIAIVRAPKPCCDRRAGEMSAAHTCRAQSLYCANQPRPAPFGSGASDVAERRNKAIAPYDPHYASFNSLNPLICRDASSSVRTSDLSS
jgi:hypothetical protein